MTVTAVAQTLLGGGAAIQGIVRSKQVPLPGAIVTVTDAAGSKTVTAITEVNGQYILKVAGPGKYHVSVDMSLFTAGSADVDVPDADKPVQKDFDLALLSQTQRAAVRPNAPAAGNRGGNAGARGGAETDTATAAADQNPFAELQTNQALALLPGMTADAATESVVQNGNVAAPTFGGAFDPRQNNFGNIGFGDQNNGQAGAGTFGAPTADAGGGQQGGGGRGGPGGRGGGGAGGRGGGFGAALGAAGGGGGRGGPGGRGGGGGGRGGGFALGGQRGRNANPINVNVTYTLADSALNASPYSIRGNSVDKPSYMQNNFGATVGGPFKIPGLLNSQQNNFNLSFTGTRNTTPYDQYSTVPTLAERSGDFSQVLARLGATTAPIQIYDPLTGLAFLNNQIPANRINSAATGLLAYIPEPNLPGDTRNFHYITTNTSDSDNINFRIQHTFRRPTPQRGQRGAAAGGGGGGGRGGGGGGGGRGGGGRGGGTLSVQVQIQRANNETSNPFPTVGGDTSRRGINTQVQYSRPIGRFQSQMQFSYNRNHNESTNFFANKTDVAGNLGINGVSRDPADWGLPTLSFTNFSSLNDRTPSNTDNDQFRVSDQLTWNRRRHNIQFGGDFSKNINDVHSTTGNPRGTFTFTGVATSLLGNSGARLASSGFDMADFLLGLPLQTTIQYGANGHSFRYDGYDFFIQDDWRWRGNLTLQYGLRYEYSAPVTEKDDHLVNLDVAPDFSAVVPVFPGQTGPYSGELPRSLVRPDRNNFAPRIGLAWSAPGKFVVRAGFGISYNGGVYTNMANQFVRQPPFATTQNECVQYEFAITGTNCTIPASSPLTLQNGFPPITSTVTNNFAVDPNYVIGYAQQWNLAVQRNLPYNIQLVANYIGVKGTHLDVAQSPNRSETGLRIDTVQPFVLDTSVGNSIYNGGSLQLNRRLVKGIQIGGTYTYSKMLDDVSSFTGGSGTNVAQDALNLRGEYGPSNGDHRHTLQSNFLIELPFGTNKHFLNKDNILNRLLGNWQVNGTTNFSSGAPFTPRVTGSTCDIARGTNSTLRPNYNGEPLAISDQNTNRWFNTDAFSAPIGCSYGNAGRNIIRGPAARSFNATLNKGFRLQGTRTLDVRIQINNVFNMVTYSGINTTVNSTQFGQVTSAAAMRTMTIQGRYRF